MHLFCKQFTVAALGMASVEGELHMPGQPSATYLNDNQLEVFGHIAKKSGIETLRPGRRVIAFGWYGGKFSHLDWLPTSASRMSSLL
jgi:hypothetical protein